MVSAARDNSVSDVEKKKISRKGVGGGGGGRMETDW